MIRTRSVSAVLAVSVLVVSLAACTREVGGGDPSPVGLGGSSSSAAPETSGLLSFETPTRWEKPTWTKDEFKFTTEVPAGWDEQVTTAFNRLFTEPGGRVDLRIEAYLDGGGPQANARAEKARLMTKSGFLEVHTAPELSKADLNGRDAASFDYLIDRGDQTWYSITTWMGYESDGGSTIARVTLSYLYSISIEEQEATTPVLTRALRAVEL